MATVFITYSGTGTEFQVAKALEQRLLATGHRIKIPVGSPVSGNWRAKYTKALLASDALVAVLGERALQSPYVLGEIGATRAMEHARGMLLLPVRLPGVGIPNFVSDIYSFELPALDDAAISDMAKQLDDAIRADVKLVPRIFISHRHKDSEIAEKLTDLLQTAFLIQNSDIRCTSVQPFMLTPGERTSEQLRADIAGAELVIGLLGPHTTDSNYVLCELGASWGRDVSTFPILIRGATLANVPSPLNERHCIPIEKTENCLHLVEYIAGKTSLIRQPSDALTTSAIAQKAKALADVSGPRIDESSEWEHLFNANYTGPVWMELQAPDAPGNNTYEILIRWGTATYIGALSLATGSHAALTFTKHNPDLVPIRVHVSPPCRILFGENQPPRSPSLELKWNKWSNVDQIGAS